MPHHALDLHLVIDSVTSPQFVSNKGRINLRAHILLYKGSKRKSHSDPSFFFYEMFFLLKHNHYQISVDLQPTLHI